MSRASIIVAVCGVALGSGALGAEIIVPTQMPLSVALATAANGDTITLLPSGSPYQQYPGFSFSGKRLTIRGSTGNPENVVLDGAGLDIVLRIDGAGAADSVLQGLTIRNGRGAATANANGAGLSLTNGAHVTLKNCVVRDNVNPAADGNGAGVFASLSNVRLEDCLLENNKVLSNIGDGAGLFVERGSVTALRTTFTWNGVSASVSPVSGALGGTCYGENGAWSLIKCRFENGVAWDGGGVYIGAGASAVVDSCEFLSNAARYGGGFYAASNSSGITIRNSVFRGNAVSVDYVAAALLRSTAIINCTFAGNTGAGNYVLGGANGTTLDNSIVWGNTVGTGIAPASQVLVRHGILQSAYTGATGSRNNRVADPKFRSTTDLRTAGDSPVIDAGDSSLYSGPFVDLLGSNRAVDVPAVVDTGLALLGPVIDIGAYEYMPVTCPADIDDGSMTGSPDGGVTIDDLIYFLTRFEGGC